MQNFEPDPFLRSRRLQNGQNRPKINSHLVLLNPPVTEPGSLDFFFGFSNRELDTKPEEFLHFFTTMAAMLVEFLLPGTCTPDRDPPVTKPRVPRWKKEEINLSPPVTVPTPGRMCRGGGLVTGGGG